MHCGQILQKKSGKGQTPRLFCNVRIWETFGHPITPLEEKIWEAFKSRLNTCGDKSYSLIYKHLPNGSKEKQKEAPYFVKWTLQTLNLNYRVARRGEITKADKKCGWSLSSSSVS